MQKELNPIIVFGAIGVVAIAVIVTGYILLAPKKFVADTTGSEQDMKRVQNGEPMYKPPAAVPGIVVPGSASSGPPGPGTAPVAPTGR